VVCNCVNIKKPRNQDYAAFCVLAEKGGFEPPVGYEPTHAFQACDLNHSSISPNSSNAFNCLKPFGKLESIAEFNLTVNAQFSGFCDFACFSLCECEC
jgi:hypothetical protein